MDRPHGTTDRVVADAARRAAVERAQRVAHLARRRAAARRRALLTAVLLVAVVVGWGAVAVASAGVLAGAVPSAGLLVVLALGRAAVRAGERADAAWAAGAADRQAVPVATAGARTVGRAVRPSDARTEVLARVPRQRAVPAPAPGAADAAPAPAPSAGGAEVHGRTVPQRAPSGADERRPTTAAVPTQREEPAAVAAAPAGEPGGAAGPVPQRTSAWSPVPVPPPAYTLKPSAPRREPAPLPSDEHLASSVGRAAADDAPDADAAPATPPVTGSPDAAAPLDLDAILARRRASGE